MRLSVAKATHRLLDGGRLVVSQMGNSFHWCCHNWNGYSYFKNFFHCWRCVNMLLEEEKPEAPIGFCEWEITNEVFLKKLKETILSVGEKGNCVVFIGSVYTPEEAMYVIKQEVTEFNRIVNAKYADLNAGILAKISPTFQYKLEAYLLKGKNFIILVPEGTDITEFFTTEEIQKII